MIDPDPFGYKLKAVVYRRPSADINTLENIAALFPAYDICAIEGYTENFIRIRANRHAHWSAVWNLTTLKHDFGSFRPEETAIQTVLLERLVYYGSLGEQITYRYLGTHLKQDLLNGISIGDGDSYKIR